MKQNSLSFKSESHTERVTMKKPPNLQMQITLQRGITLKKYQQYCSCFKKCEKWPDTEFFLVRIFLYWDWIRSFIQYERCSIFFKKKIFFLEKMHCVKSVQIRSFFLSLFSCIQSEYRKIQTRKNSLYGHFSRSDMYVCFLYFDLVWNSSIHVNIV